MAIDHIRYDLLAQDALRGMVRKILGETAKTGLPHEHHFYITFDTHHPGVKISSRLLEKYPEEMTIVIQHQFWGLVVTDYAFEIGLSFSGIPERLLIPFGAIKGFFDPSVQFGLQFETVNEEAPKVFKPREVGAKEQPTENEPDPVKLEPKIEAKLEGKKTAKGKAKAKTEEEKPVDEPSEGATIVSLDKFRKK